MGGTISEKEYIAWPDSFSSFEELARRAGTCTYSILHLRPGMETTDYSVSSATGFLAGPNKMITAGHVAVDDYDQTKNKLGKSDWFIFICKTANYWHISPRIRLTIDENCHIYPDIDLMIIDLPDEFYGTSEFKYQSPNNFLRISEHTHGLGADAAVLSYPLQDVKYVHDGRDLRRRINLRAQRGIVSSRKFASIKNNANDGIVKSYRLDYVSNSGSSGAPLLDPNTGRYFGVHFAGHREDSDWDDNYYSVAVSTENFVDQKLHKKHGLV